jgi:uncharacterized protein involved in exopolysaccharide biosynthesis
LFQNLSPIVGEQAVGEMLAHFPATEGEKPVTKDHLDARIAEVRTEIAEVRGEVAQVRGEVGDVRAEVGGLRGDITALRGELKGELKSLRAELDAKVEHETKRILYWFPGTVAAICAAIAFITRLTI